MLTHTTMLLMKRFVISLGLVLVFSAAKTQEADSLAIRQLSAQLEELRNLVVQKDSLQYEETREVLMNGFHNSYGLYQMIKARQKEISDQQFSIRLLNLNNPGTAQMVKQFEDFMKRLVSEKLSAVLSMDTLRKRKIFRTLENIFQNPIIAPILNSNPISTAISSAFNFIGSLVEPKVDIDKTFTGAVKDVKVKLDNIIDKTLLEGLTADLVPYIRFFDTLYVVNSQFSTRLSLLKQQSKALAESYDRVWAYFKGLGLKIEETPVAKQKLFEQTFPEVAPAGAMTRYAHYLHTEKIRDAVRHSNEVLTYYHKCNQLTEEYNTALRDFRDQYIAVLGRYKDRLTLYAAVLQQAYAELTARPEVVDGMIMPGDNVQHNPDINPLEKKVRQVQWSYLPMDREAGTAAEKITTQKEN